MTASEVPASGVHWLTEPVTTKSAPSTNAAAADSGDPMPPAAPMRIRCGYRYRVCISSRSRTIAGMSAYGLPASVCPPESASTHTSPATGSDAATAASSAVSAPSATSRSSSACGGGLRNAVATSGRDTFATTYRRVRGVPSGARYAPWKRKCTSPAVTCR